MSGPDDRLSVSVKVAFAGLLLFILSVFLTIVVLGPLVVDHYRPDPLIVVPVVTSLGGMVLMLLGIEVAFWANRKNGGGDK